jgi:glucokinase
MAALSLVADIGGTNSRFALCEPGTLDLLEPRKFANRDFDSMEAVVAHYLAQVQAEPKQACIAVAGPIASDTVQLTNIDWRFSRSEVRRQFGFHRLHIANDFTALAMAVPHLGPDRIIHNGGGEAAQGQPVAVLGPGTGLGVSGLLPYGKRWIPLQGEGGNASFSPGTALEVELLRYAQRHLDYVRAENFISGAGMGFLHEAMAAVAGQKIEALPNDEITRRGLTGECVRCEETLLTFCGMLGSFAGDIALLLGARGGVYIGGGIVPILGEFFFRSPFRSRFEAKGKFTSYVRPIPTYVMLSFTEMALIGAAALLNSLEE